MADFLHGKPSIFSCAYPVYAWQRNFSAINTRFWQLHRRISVKQKLLYMFSVWIWSFLSPPKKEEWRRVRRKRHALLCTSQRTELTYEGGLSHALGHSSSPSVIWSGLGSARNTNLSYTLQPSFREVKAKDLFAAEEVWYYKTLIRSLYPAFVWLFLYIFIDSVWTGGCFTLSEQKAVEDLGPFDLRWFP